VEVDIEFQRKLGLVTVNGGCSGTLLNRYWVLTARHCITVNGQPASALLPPNQIQMTAAWAPGRVGRADRVHDFAVNSAAPSPDRDIVLVYLGNNDLGEVYSNQKIYAAARDMGNGSVRITGQLRTTDEITQYGQGLSTFATGATMATAVPGTGAGVFRSARFTPSNISETHYDLAMNSNNQVGHGGDSGGPSVFTLHNYGHGIAGVQSTCQATGYVPNSPTPKEWRWATGIRLCTYVSTAPFINEISNVIREAPAAVANTTYVPPGGWKPWFRITDGVAGMKASVTALKTRDEWIDLFITGSDGHIYSTFWNQQDGWKMWSRIGDLKVPAGTPVTAHMKHAEWIDLFVVGGDGGIYTTFWNPKGGWQKWFRISDLQAPAGASVTALSKNPEWIDLFATGKDGNIYTTYWNPKDGWVKSFRISELQAPPGAPVTVLLTRPDWIDLFITGKDGAIYTTYWNPKDWWVKGFRISELQAPPGAPVTAVKTRNEWIDLFVTGNDGNIYSTFWNANDGWTKGFRASELQASPGSPVTALLRSSQWIDLFVTGKDGGIHTTYWNSQSGWEKGYRISDTNAAPYGTLVAALPTRPNWIDLFVVGKDGGIQSTFWKLEERLPR
jgi:hypothetical protein